MITRYLIIFTTISILLLLMGGIVLLRNVNARINRCFFALTILLSSWMITNYFSNDSTLAPELIRIFNHLALLFAGLSIVAVLRFVLLVTNNVSLNRHYQAIALFNYAAMLLTLTPLMIISLQRQGEAYAITFGPAAYIYFPTLVLDVALVIYALVKGIRNDQGDTKVRSIIILVTLGALLSVNLITNALLPVFGFFGFTNAGPMTSIILAFGFAYVIVKHKLFDIRPVIARTAGYLLSVATLATAYGLLVFGVAHILFDLELSFGQQLALSIATGVAALTFHNFKRIFDKVTNSLFYRDAYDTETLFDEYNKALVSTIDLNQLLKRVSKVVVDHLKAGYCVAFISNDVSRGVGSSERVLSDHDTRIIRNSLKSSSHSVLDTDELPPGTGELESVLRNNDIALVLRLSTLKESKNGMNYLVLGSKKSGNPYTSQDIKVIETLANELIIALQNALRFEEIERFNETLQQKVKDATYKLRESNKKLKQLNESKDDFIGMASHQLRTPLTSVKGYLSLVVDGDAGKINDTQKQLLQQAYTSSQKMVYLIADLLNVSRLKTGKFVIERAPVNLDKLISEEMGQLKQEAVGRGLELTYVVPKNFPTLPLDETKTRQVVMNFLDNAIYYTPSGGHVRVELTNLPKSVEFRVVDDGIGVPKDERHRLFTKFYRARNAQRARPDGTGLGLYMAQKVITVQGGAIIFNSEYEKGSTFGFTFPKDLPADTVTLPPQTQE